jgi:uncharacterized membrane protein (DUF4010 family)
MGDSAGLISSPYIQILLVLGLSFLMGLEREEHKVQPGTYVAAGVRTFPLIALLGYMLVVLSPENLLPAAAGLIAVSVFLVISYQHKIADGSRGFTSEMAALVAYAVGALIARNQAWIAVSVAVADVLLLSAKQSLEGLARRLDEGELTTFVKFLLLTGVILPVLPNQSFTQFGINPFKTWLIVVVVSGMSYGSYLLQRCVKAKQSALLSALLGGAYSSTLTTVTLAKESVGQGQPKLYSGAIVLASAVMYLRLGILIYIFNPALAQQLQVTFAILIVMTAVAGLALMAARSRAETAPASGVQIDRNPLELGTAFLFAALFIILSVATRLVSQYLGSAGVYALAGIMGVTDIDPFIMGLAQTGGPSAAAATPIATAALAVIIAAASNNVVKGIYATSFGGRRVGIPALIALAGIGIAGIIIFVM